MFLAIPGVYIKVPTLSSIWQYQSQVGVECTIQGKPGVYALEIVRETAPLSGIYAFDGSVTVTLTTPSKSFPNNPIGGAGTYISYTPFSGPYDSSLSYKVRIVNPVTTDYSVIKVPVENYYALPASSNIYFTIGGPRDTFAYDYLGPETIYSGHGFIFDVWTVGHGSFIQNGIGSPPSGFLAVTSPPLPASAEVTVTVQLNGTGWWIFSRTLNL